jgi:hypothetical protein
MTNISSVVPDSTELEPKLVPFARVEWARRPETYDCGEHYAVRVQ